MRRIILLAALTVLLASCSSQEVAVKGYFPNFISTAENHYVARIGEIPQLDSVQYKLDITGLVATSASFSLKELQGMRNIEVPVTMECVGNKNNGTMVSTAVWKGVRLYDILSSLGISSHATGVRYQAADGYYAHHTIEQVKNGQVILALYMNDKPMLPKHGYPVRVILPGYYGEKQPGWVTSIEVTDRPVSDFWEDRGWKTSVPMPIDSVIFLPKENSAVYVKQPIKVGGASFGGTRVGKVEVSTDGKKWREAKITRRMDADNVWVYWESQVSFSSPGTHTVYARAYDVYDNVQPQKDKDEYDGENAWAAVSVNVQERK